MQIRALSTAEAADRAGLQHEALRSLMRRGQFAEADVVIGGTKSRLVRGWTPETIDAWTAERRQ